MASKAAFSRLNAHSLTCALAVAGASQRHPAISAPGTITLTGVGAGNATVTLTVSDGINPAVSMPFAVTVAAVNSPPSIAPIGPQALNAGTTLDVGYSATDPDNDPLTADVSSDNTGVVTAIVSANGIAG